jgi:dimeric dUTPase (all-alpha-NTP-PPase superfamily)
MVGKSDSCDKKKGRESIERRIYMNLSKLFELQRKLDEHIVKEKGLEGQDLLPKKILALQVELGELANEWRGFKFWSNHQEPRTQSKVVCHVCNGHGGFVHTDEYQQATEPFEECLYCEGTGFQEDKNPLLEEYVDCLHFILSIGLEINLTPDEHVKWKRFTVIEQFNDLFGYTSDLFKTVDENWAVEEQFNAYEELLAGFMGLGEMLGFTWEQVEQAYLEKNKINHERQRSAY